jgi:ABC-type branched-subunit amino acid transport system substrate-binding protein
VIKDKRAVLGPNRGRVKLLLSSGFATRATIAAPSSSARGALIGVSGLPLTRVNGEARRLVEALRRRFGGGRLDPSVLYAAEAARLVLSAIETAGADRAKIAAKLVETDGKGGFIGDYEISKTGDPTTAHVTIYVARDEFEPLTVAAPSAELVAAALGRR